MLVCDWSKPTYAPQRGFVDTIIILFTPETIQDQDKGNNLNAVKMPGRIMPWEIDGDIVSKMEDLIDHLTEFDKIAEEEYGMRVRLLSQNYIAQVVESLMTDTY